MELELIVLVATALLIGATGTWSPCGFSMVETIGPTGHTGGLPVTLAACATFLPGALVGGILTFGGLALAGAALPGDPGWLSSALAVAVALAAAVAEARGARIAPQVRRQLPEHWRRVLPMPVAAALYGVLLGLGFTTFVLTFGVWALAGIALALGEPALGVAIGLGFGLGRAVPIVALAPLARHPLGRSAIGAMADRPGLYRGIRLGDATALLATAAVLGATAAEADVRRVPGGADPSADAGELVSQHGAKRSGQLRDGSDEVTKLPGTDPAIGGSYIAVLDDGDVALLERETLVELDRLKVRGADALAVSGGWLAVRTRVNRRDGLQLHSIEAPGRIGGATPVAAARAPAQLGRPSFDPGRLAYAVARRGRSKLVIFNIAEARHRTILQSVTAGLSNPAIFGRKLLYVRATRSGDELRLRDLKGGRDRVLRSGDARLWSTELTGRRAYVTVLRGTKPRARIVSKRR